VTDLEKRAVAALRSVKMPEQGWHGRRAESLKMRLTLQPESRLGITEAADVWFLVWRYRRQIKDAEVVIKANEILNGVLHLEFQ
jgi:hypothetical protein